MTKEELQAIEQQIVELKIKQGNFFKKKKAERNPEEIAAIRSQLNDLKAKAKSAYRPNQSK